MQTKKQKNKTGKDPLENYDPTARNFEQPNDEDDEMSTGVENEYEEDNEEEPELDEETLEENELTDDEADDIEWEPAHGKSKKGNNK